MSMSPKDWENEYLESKPISSLGAELRRRLREYRNNMGECSEHTVSNEQDRCERRPIQRTNNRVQRNW